VVQIFALRDVAASGHHAIVEQWPPAERPRQRHQQALVVTRGDLVHRLELAIRPHHHRSGAALPDRPWDERGQCDRPTIAVLTGDPYRWPGTCARARQV
jgi:hypothetical protein